MYLKSLLHKNKTAKQREINWVSWMCVIVEREQNISWEINFIRLNKTVCISFLRSVIYTKINDLKIYTKCYLKLKSILHLLPFIIALNSVATSAAI